MKYYYLTLFKIKGHKTFRTHISRDEGGFNREAKVNNFPEVTEKKIIRIDGLTGDMEIK